MRQTFRFGGVSVNPEIIRNFLVGFVHYNDRDFSVRVEKSSGIESAAARRTGDSFRSGLDEFGKIDPAQPLWIAPDSGSGIS